LIEQKDSARDFKSKNASDLNRAVRFEMALATSVVVDTHKLKQSCLKRDINLVTPKFSCYRHRNDVFSLKKMISLCETHSGTKGHSQLQKESYVWKAQSLGQEFQYMIPTGKESFCRPPIAQ